MTLKDFTPLPFEPRYGVSRDGRVCRFVSIDWLRPGVVEPRTDKDGYLWVFLNYRKHRVNRLVAVTFIPNPENKPEAAHINGSNTDNRVENIKWATRLENENDKKIHGTRPIGEAHWKAKLSETDVKDIREMFAGKIPRVPPLYAEIAEAYGVKHSAIMSIVKRRGWAHV